ncbi:uncharacterized protein LOC126847384 isoform X1 [Adelges cooleyi]|uniref:uncharacterized protein LOC126847384 isoform X1 n=1 Tax=Adelges cooleyi TaxID=133065 RepID=UPI002180384D|nr:uncharacterized protein LOC126847384 isoform X1 [Adelges cooleyi]
MKLFCFLLSIVFVNVSTDEPIETTYKRQIAINNTLIEVAHNMNNCIVEDNFISNGLEHVIKHIVFNDVFLLDTEYIIVNFIMQATVLPEYPWNNSMLASLVHQHTLKKVFVDELKITAPEVPSEDLMNLDLPQLGDQRRNLIGIAVKNIICQAIDFENVTNLLEERRHAPTGNSRNRIIRASDRNLYQVPFKKMCEFIIMFLLTKYPIEVVHVRSDEEEKTCALQINYTPEVRMYREIDGIWWQVPYNDLDNPIETLKNQIC